MTLILAIDGGGSRTRCLVVDESGRILGAGSGGASNHLLVDKKVVRTSLENAMQSALAHARTNSSDVDCISAGLAGVDFDGRGAEEMKALFFDFGFTGIVVSGDMIAAHAGALAGKSGVLALAGTGSCILGIDDDGTRVKVGGWGPIFGDEGSAYRVGQEALRAAARDFDGRGPKTKLTIAVANALGITNFQESIDAVYLGDMHPRDIAGLSNTVYKIAQTGDAIALGIFERAGAELAECVGAAINRLTLDGANVDVSYQGSVMTECEFMRESFYRSLADKFPDASVHPPRFPPVIGAYLLGRTALGLANDERLLPALDESIRGLSDELS